VRGALQPIPGVLAVDVTPGKQDFTVAYDPGKASVDRMLAALKDAREPATVRN
jgi:copper chaperone CopZ